MQARVQTKPHKYIMINMRQITITGCLMDLLLNRLHHATLICNVIQLYKYRIISIHVHGWGCFALFAMSSY